MIRYPNMLMLGSAGRNVGKTEFACRLIHRYRHREQVIGLKITTINGSNRPCPRGSEGCGVCTSFTGKYQLTRETAGPAGKDTVRMLEAGAHRVYWLKVREQFLREGILALSRYLDDSSCIICESNSSRRVLNPGMFLVMRKKGSSLIKKSCRHVIHEADKVLAFHGNGWDLGVDQLVYSDEKWTFPESATAIVLAGGQSRRMGVDKSLLFLSGTPMIEVIVNQLKGNFQHLQISSNDPVKYDFLNLPVVPDLKSGAGPLMGILSSLENSKTDLNFITSCDAPNINLPYVREMLRAAEHYDAVIPMSKDGRYEPLFAVYRKSVIGHCHDLIDTGHRKISDLFERARIKFLPFDGSGWYENLNTIEDLKHYKNRFLSGQGTSHPKMPVAMTG
ncbi:MAG: molybdenum cofactor guanylyltransferase [Deltaproteobacteria bacterium]|nr:molybdenum cofactor guanylyltransferase [Deltaproteobacteria bacterium]